MAKQKVKLDKQPQETPKEKESLEDLLTEKGEIENEEEKKAKASQEEAEKQAKEKEAEEEIDLDEEREKTKKEVTESVTKEVIEPLKKQIIDLKETLTPTEKDDYDKFVDDYTEKNGKAPEWKQVATFLEERGVNRIKEELKAEKEAEQKIQDDLTKTQEATATENFKIWQGQLTEMEEKGMLPKMEKPEEGDKGFDARVKLYGHMQASWKSATPITNLYEVYSKFYTKGRIQGEQPAGEDAPILDGSGAADDGEKEVKYSDIHSGGQDLESYIFKELQKAGKSSS